MIKVLFYPPIADKHRVVEYSIPARDVIAVADFFALLKSRPDLGEYFDRIAAYGGCGDLFRDAIIIINGSDASRTAHVKSGDVVKIIMPLAGG